MKWFGAGVLLAGSAAALIVTLVLRQPRTLPPMMSIAPTQEPDQFPVEAQHQVATLAPSPATPLSPMMASMLAPNATPAPADSLPVAQPTVAPKPSTQPAPVAPAPQPAPPVPAAPKPTAPKPHAPQPTVTPTATPAVSGGTINVNTATSAELELLPQIGPAMAARIIEYRTAHGDFKSLNDLDKVKGIGSKTLAKLKPLIRFE